MFFKNQLFGNEIKGVVFVAILRGRHFQSCFEQFEKGVRGHAHRFRDGLYGERSLFQQLAGFAATKSRKIFSRRNVHMFFKEHGKVSPVEKEPRAHVGHGNAVRVFVVHKVHGAVDEIVRGKRAFGAPVFEQNAENIVECRENFRLQRTIRPVLCLRLFEKLVNALKGALDDGRRNGLYGESGENPLWERRISAYTPENATQ